MDFNKCSRCGNFYVSENNVCPKCGPKDNLEFSTFKSYIQENGFTGSLDSIAVETGISVKNLNRFLKYEDFQEYNEQTKLMKENTGFTGITFN